MKFNVIIEKKDESGYYVAEVPALPGCLSQGKTFDEAKENIKEGKKVG
jgi:predicted RNase H-like HicB family nuclease